MPYYSTTQFPRRQFNSSMQRPQFNQRPQFRSAIQPHTIQSNQRVRLSSQRGLPRAYGPRMQQPIRLQSRYPQRPGPQLIARRAFAPQIVQQKNPGLVGNIIKFLLTPPKRNTAPKRPGFIGNMINYQRTRTKWGL
ncbi:MAG: hypothetical protein WCW44_05150 [archaeon]|jgi:hypothetical protein